MTEGGYLHKTSDFDDDGSRYYEDGEGTLIDNMKKDGVPVNGLRMFRFDKDYSNPSMRSEILEELENATKYTR